MPSRGPAIQSELRYDRILIKRLVACCELNVIMFRIDYGHAFEPWIWECTLIYDCFESKAIVF